jgi:hypothetical protein
MATPVTATVPIGCVGGWGKRQSRAKGGGGQHTCIHDAILLIVAYLNRNRRDSRIVPETPIIL